MTKQVENVAHSELVSGSQTSLHSHSGGSGESVVILAYDVQNSTTNLIDCTGLQFTAEPNSKYIIDVWTIHDSTLSSVGIKLSLNGPSSPIIVSGLYHGAATLSSLDGSALNTYDQSIATSGSAYISGNLTVMHALLHTGGNGGMVVVRFACEAAGTIIIKAGSILRYMKIG